MITSGAFAYNIQYIRHQPRHYQTLTNEILPDVLHVDVCMYSCCYTPITPQLPKKPSPEITWGKFTLLKQHEVYLPSYILSKVALEYSVIKMYNFTIK